MTKEERIIVGGRWLSLAQMHGRDISAAGLTEMLNAVMDLPGDRLMAAMDQWVKNSLFPRHPTPAELRLTIEPLLNPRDLAVATIGRIKEAVRMFGWPKPTAAREFIGDAGWLFVERAGGWQAVCESPDLNLNDTGVVAQLRDSIESDIKLERSGVDMSRPLIEQMKERRGLESASEIVKRLVPKKEEK